MSNRGDAFVLATAIYAGHKTLTIETLEDRLYAAVASIGLGADEVKADIYAQLAERLTAKTTFADALVICEGAISETRRAIGG